MTSVHVGLRHLVLCVPMPLLDNRVIKFLEELVTLQVRQDSPHSEVRQLNTAVYGFIKSLTFGCDFLCVTPLHSVGESVCHERLVLAREVREPFRLYTLHCPHPIFVDLHTSC